MTVTNPRRGFRDSQAPQQQWAVEEEVAEDEEREPLCLCEYWDRKGVSLEQS